MHREALKFKQSVLTRDLPASSIGIRGNNVRLYIQPRQWSYMRTWNRLNTFCFIWYKYFLTWCAHANTIWSYLYVIDHIEVADEFTTL